MSDEPADVSAESLERFRTIAEQAPVLIWLNGLEGCEFVNRAYLEFLGVASEVDVRRFVWAQFVHPGDRDRYVQAYLDCFARLAPFEARFRFRRRDGVFRWMKSVGQPRLGPAGEMLGYVGSTFDITDLVEATEALHGRESHFHAMADAMLQLAWIARADGHIFWYNQRWYDYTGTTAEEMEGWGWQKVHDPAELPNVLARWQASIATAEPFEMVFPLRGADGRFRQFLTRAIPLKNSTGEVEQWFGTNTDVHEIKRAEEELADSRARLEGIVGSAMDAIITIDDEQRIILFNAAAEKMFGCPAADALGSAIDRFIPARFRKDHGQHVRSFGETGTTSRAMGALGALSAVRVSGEEFPIEASISQVEVRGRRLFTVILRDITARKRAQEAAQELAAIVESAGDAIVGKNLDGIIRSWNPSAERLFGYRAEEIIGQSVTQLIPAERIEEESRILARIRSGERVTEFETVRRRKDGSLLDVSISVSPVHDESGAIVGASKIVRDNTERKRMETATAQRARQRAAVADLSQHALAGRDLERLMNDAVAVVAQVLGVEFSKLLELNEAGDALLLRAGVGWREGLVGVYMVPQGGESQAGYTLLSNAPVIVEDLATETRFHGPALLIEHGVVSGMSVIIGGRARPFGVLGTHTTQRRSFSSDDVHFLQSVADLLATAIERRQLEEELLAATGREQRRLGQDLHDGLCQHLSGIEFRNEALARALEDDPAAREEVEKIGALLREGTQQARMLARGLAPVELEKNGLMSALTELAANSAHLYRIECHFTCEQPVLVTNEAAATHLYRIAQEAISNAVRHARAKSIEITLRPVGDEALLTIANDGTPLPAEPEREGGMGLRIMRYRAELIGATLRLGSTAEGKTELNCTFNPHG